jgi:DNA-binding beta-propeller fold protein YncE
MGPTRLIAVVLAVGALTTPAAHGYSVISSPTAFAPTALALSPVDGTAVVVGTGTTAVAVSIPALADDGQVTLDADARAVAFRPDGAWAYVALGSTDHLGIIDTGARPLSVVVADMDSASSTSILTGIAVHAGNSRVYIALDIVDSGAVKGRLLTVTADDNVEIHSSHPLPIDPGAVAITPDGQRALVTAANESKLVEVNLATGTPTTHSIPVVSPDLAIDTAGTFVYVAGQADMSQYAVVKLRLPAGSVEASLPLASPSNPGGIALNPVTGLLYVAQRGGDGGVAVVDTAGTMAVTGMIPTSLRAAMDIALDADGHYAYAALGAPQNGIARIQLRPDAPTGLRATPGDRSATIAFEAGFDNGAAIETYAYSLDDGATWTTLRPARAASPVTIDGLENGRPYAIRLRALNGQAPGPPSAAVAVTPAAADAAADRPARASLRTSRAKVSRRAITTSFAASGPGSATVTGSVVTAARAGRAKAVTACTGKARVKQAGTVRMTCTLTKRARALRRTGAVTVRLVTAFTPTGGTRAAGTQTVVLKKG